MIEDRGEFECPGCGWRGKPMWVTFHPIPFSSVSMEKYPLCPRCYIRWTAASVPQMKPVEQKVDG